MAKVKFDVSGSNPDEALAGNFEPPQPGVYKSKVFECKQGFKKVDGKPDKSQPRLEVTYEIIEKKYKGARVYDYISFGETSQWKLDQFLQAFGLASKKKRKGTFDTDSVQGGLCKVRVKADTYNGEYSAKVGAVMALAEDEDADEDVDEDDVDDLEEDEEGEESEESEEDDESDEDEEDEEDSDEESDDDLLTEEGLGELDIKALKKIATDDFEIEDLPKGKSKIIAAILEAQGAGGDKDEPEDDYDDWGPDALRKELKDRELSTKGGKQALIDRLREDDGGDPF